MSEIKRIGLDTSKAVLTLHCVDQTGRQVLQTNLRRAQTATFFSKLALPRLPWKLAAAPITGRGNWPLLATRCARSRRNM